MKLQEASIVWTGLLRESKDFGWAKEAISKQTRIYNISFDIVWVNALVIKLVVPRFLG